MNKFLLSRISWAPSILLALAAAAQAQQAQEPLRNSVGSESDAVGAGLVLDEDVPKASSAATKLQFTPSISVRRVNREFTNFSSPVANTSHSAATLNGIAGPFNVNNKAHLSVFPGLTGSFQLTPTVQGFSSLSKSVTLSGNGETGALVNGVPVANGAGTVASVSPLRSRQETSVALDMGALYKSSLFKASATAFLVKFKDRIASSFDPGGRTTPDFNLGNSSIKGLELEAGTLPVLGFSAYASATYIQGYADSGMPALGSPLAVFGEAGRPAAHFPANALLFADTPKRKAALSLQYMSAPLLVNLAGKYTGPRITVLGDQSLAGFTTFDLNVALQLPSDRLFKSPVLRLDVSNITNKRFPLSHLPSLYGGAPRVTSITLQNDF